MYQIYSDKIGAVLKEVINHTKNARELIRQYYTTE